MMSVQQLLDQALDTARAAHPGVEFAITLSHANALSLPKDTGGLWRDDPDMRQDFYHGHVYRDCLVTEVPSLGSAPIDFLVIVSPVSGTSAQADDAVSYYGDLRSGTIVASLPGDAPNGP